MGDSESISILLADEFTLVREGIARVCDWGDRFTVVDQCSDGVVALQRIQALKPDIALVDLQVPKLFSLELIRKAREQELPTKFIVLAGRGDRKTALEALRAGANGFVLKSSPATELVDALRNVAMGSVYVSPELQFEKIFMGSKQARTGDPVESLSSREYQVFRLMIDGIRAKEIAAQLDLSPKTVDTYRASLMRKLDIHDVAGLVKFAIQRDLVSI